MNWKKIKDCKKGNNNLLKKVIINILAYLLVFVFLYDIAFCLYKTIDFSNSWKLSLQISLTTENNFCNNINILIFHIENMENTDVQKE